MRKLIVRNFALDCWVVLFGKTYNYTRSARFIFPSFILAFLCQYTAFEWVAYAVALTCIFFGFIYFRIKPLTGQDFDYMTDTQKVQFGLKATDKLNNKQFDEYLKITSKLKEKYGI